MNFDFLKGVRGLGALYENCNNAEKLAMSMPVQSVFTSRKSAELLAKFLYMAAHNQEMEDLSFADILSDQAVKRFINNRDVMDAFHFIRRTGNRAVHTTDSESPEDALDVLHDLHFVAGETARRLGLIRDYPPFDDDVESFPNAVFVDEGDIEKKAREMFIDYVEEFNAQVERDKYTELSEEELFRYCIEGNVDMHEYLEFNHKPRSLELTEFLQSYLLTLLRFSVERSPDKADELGLNYPVKLDAKMIIGDRVYLSQNGSEFMRAVNEELPKAETLIIDCVCSGILREFYNDDLEDPDGRLNMILKDAAWTGAGMLDRLESYKRRDSFTYFYLSFLPDSGSLVAACINKGRSIPPSDLFDTGVRLSSDLLVDCDGLGVFFESENDIYEYPEFIEAYKKLAKEYVFEPQFHFCEEAWNPESEDYVPNCILPYVQIEARTIGDYEVFLNKLNQLVKQWKGQITLYTDDADLEDPMFGSANNALYNIREMTLAQVICTDGELRVVGAALNRKV